MANEHAIEILNNLLAAEYASLLPRLRQSNPFVTLAATEDREAVDRLIKDSERHERDLADLIMDLRGAPVPISYDIDTTSFHYITLEYLVPQILQNVHLLIDRYAGAGTTGNRQADALIGRHLADYQTHLKALEKMHGNLVAQS